MNRQALRTHREAIATLARRHGVCDLHVLGSTVRGTADPHSDLDLLVQLQPGRSLLDRAAFPAVLDKAPDLPPLPGDELP